MAGVQHAITKGNQDKLQKLDAQAIQNYRITERKTGTEKEKVEHARLDGWPSDEK